MKTQNFNKDCRYQLDDPQAQDVSYQVLEKLQALKVNANPIHFLLIYEWMIKSDPYFAEQIDLALSLKAYNDDTAFQLFHQAMALILNRSLPSEDFNLIINNLLENMNQWLQESAQNSAEIEDGLSFIEKQDLSQELLDRFKKQVLPAIQSQQNKTSTLTSSITATQQEIKRLKYELEKVTQISVTDELTNIPNRRGFNQKIQSIIEEAQEQQTSFALLVLDIDLFKKINDTYGHLLGDSILRYLARFLNNETKGKDLVARIGGEEFVVALPNTNYDSAIRVAEQMRSKLFSKKLNIKSADHPISVSVSLGVASYQMGESLETLFDRADKALYRAKNSGRNKVVGEAS